MLEACLLPLCYVPTTPSPSTLLPLLDPEAQEEGLYGFSKALLARFVFFGECGTVGWREGGRKAT